MIESEYGAEDVNCGLGYDRGDSMMLYLLGYFDCFETARWLRACRGQTVWKNSVSLGAYPQRQALVLGA